MHDLAHKNYVNSEYVLGGEDVIEDLNEEIKDV